MVDAFRTHNTKKATMTDTKTTHYAVIYVTQDPDLLGACKGHGPRPRLNDRQRNALRRLWRAKSDPNKDSFVPMDRVLGKQLAAKGLAEMPSCLAPYVRHEWGEIVASLPQVILLPAAHDLAERVAREQDAADAARLAQLDMVDAFRTHNTKKGTL